MRTIWVKKVYDILLGPCYEISAECHDGYLYKGRTVAEAVRNYEADRKVKVGKICTH